MKKFIISIVLSSILLCGCNKEIENTTDVVLSTWETTESEVESRTKLEDMTMEEILALSPEEFRDICALDYPTIADNLGMNWDDMTIDDWDSAQSLYVRVKFGTYGPVDTTSNYQKVEKPEITHNYEPGTLEYFMYTDTDVYRAMTPEELRKTVVQLRDAVFPDLTDESLVEQIGMTWEEYINTLPDEDIINFMMTVADSIDQTNEELNIEFENGE